MRCPEEVIASDKKRMVVDAFARWRITDPLRFYQSMVDTETALTRLSPILSSSVRRVLGGQTFAAMLSGKRAQLMLDIRDDMNQDVSGFGIRIVDVRIRHADLPQANSEAIYQRMQKERQREANEYRAEGDETAQRIRARAEREVTILTAEATRESEILRGEGDAEKTRLLGDAYGQDPDFFAFYRSLQAYQEALGGGSTTVVLSPDSDFLKYFGKGPGGHRRVAVAAPFLPVHGEDHRAAAMVESATPNRKQALSPLGQIISGKTPSKNICVPPMNCRIERLQTLRRFNTAPYDPKLNPSTRIGCASTPCEAPGPVLSPASNEENRER